MHVSFAPAFPILAAHYNVLTNLPSSPSYLRSVSADITSTHLCPATSYSFCHWMSSLWHAVDNPLAPPYALRFPLQTKSLLEPFNYLLKQPGKNIRSHLIDAFNQWIKVPDDKLERIRRVVDMLHCASLMYVYNGPSLSSVASPYTPRDLVCVLFTMSTQLTNLG